MPAGKSIGWRSGGSVHKYHAVPVTMNGRRFASKAECWRFMDLQLMEQAGEITDLECQPEFPIHVVKLYRNGWPIEIATVAKYIADFQYTDLKTGEIVVEDVKGVRTSTYTLKRKLVEAIHGIVITEI